MPETYTDKDGNEVEMPTKEELETQQQEAINKAKEETKAEYEKQISEKEEAMQKLQDKVGNFEKLRNKTEGQEKEEAELKEKLEKMESELSETKGAAQKAINDHFMNSEIDRIAGTDEKFKEQIKANFELLEKMPAGTPAELAAKVKKAALNAQFDMGQTPTPSAFDGQNISASGGAPVKGESSTEDKEQLKGLAAAFGYSEETLKKHKKI